MKDENGRWQWRVEMVIGNKHMNEPLAFICGVDGKCMRMKENEQLTLAGKNNCGLL